MARRLSIVLAALLLGVPARAQVGVAYLHRIETVEQFERLSLAVQSPPGADRATKFLVPINDNPAHIPTLFQDVNRYRFHQEFMAGEFPDRFPGLTGREYLTLVERRDSRTYYAGVFYRMKGTPSTYTFDVFTLSGDVTELLRVEEARWIYQRLSEAFKIGPIAYSPIRQDAIENAQKWIDPGFPIKLSSGGPAVYIPYTRTENYGRVRILTPDEFHQANESGAFGWQDILILYEVPTDIEGVIAGVITAEIQGELGHLAIRTARRGTPNAYVKDAPETLASFDGKLARLAVGLDDFQLTEATIEDAEAWWSTHRPKTPEIVHVDPDYQKLDAFWDVEITRDNYLDLLKRYGGKATNGMILHSLLPEKNRVRGFGIPYYYYLQYVNSTRVLSYPDPGRRVTLAEYIEEMLADPDFRGDSRRRFAELDKLRELFEGGFVDPATALKVTRRIEEVFGTTTEMVRFRSSGNIEHLLEYNGAGLHTSTSGCAADDLDAGTNGPSRCDPAEANERSVARAMKRVWGSLWNFRAFEEREYYQIDHLRGRMGILVSDAFTGPDEELVNGVAFTGNLDVRGDRRFVVNAQLGDTPVVSPPPGVVAEKDVLEMENGEVKRIVRVRPSSMARPGELVLSDAHLREMGRIMADAEARYPVGIAPHAPEDVLLDMEFKIDIQGQLRFKDVRQFLISDTGPGIPTEFRLKVPEPIPACASFVEGRPARNVLEDKARFTIRAGEYVLRADGTSPVDILEALQLEPGGPLVSPEGPGRWTAETLTPPNEPGFRFHTYQDFLVGGERVRVSLLNLSLANARPDDNTLTPRTATWAITPLFLRMEITRPEDPQSHATLVLPCDVSHLPLTNVDTVFAGGDRVRMTERFQDVLDGTGPAELIGARLSLAGREIEVNDYWRLVYTAGHHNDLPFPEHWAILETPIDVPGAGRVKGVGVAQGFRGEEPQAFYLDEEFRRLKPLDIILFRRLREGNPEIPQFRRGDANSSGQVNVSDAIGVLLHLFAGGEVACPDAADFDDVGSIGLDDAILLLYYLFLGLDPPAFPGAQRCGEDLEPDDLSACDGSACR